MSEDALGVTVHDDVIKHESLVPDRTQRLRDDLSRPTRSTDDDTDERVRQTGVVWANETASMEDVGSQL